MNDPARDTRPSATGPSEPGSGIYPKVAPFHTGARIGDLILAERIGHGGMAEVWRAEHPSRGAVAVKRILPYLQRDPRYLDLFQYEAALGMSFEHSNLVKTLEYGSHFDEPFFVMELIDGPSCKDLLESLQRGGSRLGIGAVVHIGLGVLSALEYIHTFSTGRRSEPRLVHRDVSPANVLLDRSGKVLLSDFGIAGSALACPAREHSLKGKRGYMAPEQLAGAASDARADLFSAGVLLSELLTGGRLFETRSAFTAMVDNYSAWPDRLRGVLQGPLGRVLRIALSHSPCERFRSAAEMARALADAADHSGIEPVAVALPVSLSQKPVAALGLRRARNPAEDKSPSSSSQSEIHLDVCLTLRERRSGDRHGS